MSNSSSSDICLASSIAEISWNAFFSNWQVLEKKIGPQSKILPMVKTNAYGHDLQIISDYCAKLPIAGLGVANIFEALELRSLGFENRVVSFGRLSPETLDAAFEFKVQIVLHSLEDIQLLSSCSHPISFHVELETGMNRLGITIDQLPDVFQMLKNTQHRLEGIFTHFVESEVKSSPFTKAQIKKFDQAIQILKTKYFFPFVTHAENSGGIFNQRKHYDWVRPGISLYGFHPDAKSKKHGLTPILEWSAPIMQIKKLKKGDSVSYNRSFRAKKNMVIGTLPVGYGDGFSREYKSLYVGYKNRKCSILGNICMDLTMIDLTAIKNPQINEMVHLLGAGARGEPTAWQYAKVDRTIPYEVLTRISPRVIRTPSP